MTAENSALPLHLTIHQNRNSFKCNNIYLKNIDIVLYLISVKKKIFQVMKRFSMVFVNYNNSSITHCFCTATIIGSEASHIKAKS